MATGRVEQYMERLVFDEFNPGESLPSEGAIASVLEVSRLTVREVTGQLRTRGLILVSTGRRSIVAPPNGKGVGDFFRNAIRRDPRGLLDLLEVRMALEVHAAELAAFSASRANLVAVETALDNMRSAGDDMDQFVEADLRFHELIALGSGNQLLSMLIEELWMHGDGPAR